MIQKIKKYFVTAVALLAVAGPAGLAPVFTVGAYAADTTIQSSLCDGVGSASGGVSDCGNAGKAGTETDGLKKLAAKITNIFSVVVGAAAVIFIIFGGFRYITSGGDSGRVGNAKNTIIYALVGLIIVALAQVIVHYVINTASDTGTSIGT